MIDLNDRTAAHDALDRAFSGVTADPALATRVCQAMTNAPVRHARPARMLLIAALMILLATGALAAGRLGLFDMLAGSPQRGVSPDAALLVDTPVTLQATASVHASLTVTECLRAGSDVLLLIEATPCTDGVLLAPVELLGSGSSSGACRVRLGFDWADEDALLTHAERAGRQLIALDVHLHAPARDESSSTTALEHAIVDGELLPDGGVRLLLHVSGDAFSDWQEASLHLRFATTPVDAASAPDYALQPPYAFDERQRSAAFMTVSLPEAWVEATLAAPQPMMAVASALPIDVPEAGIRVHAMTLTPTPLYTRFDVRYTALDGTNPGDVYFFLSDAEGNWLADGLRGGSIPTTDGVVTTRVGYASALSGTQEEVFLSVMTFGSATPLALVRVPVAPVAEIAPPVSPTPIP